MFLVFNTIAIPLVLATATSGNIKITICAAAVTVHLAIMQATLRADTWLEFFDERLVELEKLDADDVAGTRVQVFSHPNFTARRRTWLASRRNFGLIGVAALIFWIWQTISQVQTALH